MNKEENPSPVYNFETGQSVYVQQVSFYLSYSLYMYMSLAF